MNTPDPMTVAELRELLATFPDDMPVLVQGYEDGYDPLLRDGVYTQTMYFNVEKCNVYGPHFPHQRTGLGTYPASRVADALVLARDVPR